MTFFHRFICRVLMASLIFLPYGANAGMIGTDEAAAYAHSATNRDKVREFMSREQVQRQLQSFGISPAAAQDRVRAMSAQEAQQLAANIDKLPAGGVSGWVWVIVVLFVAGIAWAMWSPDSKWAGRPI